MKTYHCVCGQLIFFQNVFCEYCKRELGFFPDSLTLGAIEPASNGLFMPALAEHGAGTYRKCQNFAQETVCNWMIPESEQHEVFCKSCRLTLTIPDLTLEMNQKLWGLMENAKRRLIYSLIHLKLPIFSALSGRVPSLAFRFLSDTTNSDGSITKVLTGHENGTITLNIAEADDAVREKTRMAMNEPYRTLLGHFRHEVGHYYWDRLIRDGKFRDRFRNLFGDERVDYGGALMDYYAKGAPHDWQEHCVSAYSTAHPWEDWAESWAHFLHIQDTLEVAEDFGIGWKTRKEKLGEGAQQSVSVTPENFDQTITSWFNLVLALNSINRSMGHQDLYPFVLSAQVTEKLRFVAEVISETGREVDQGSFKAAQAS